MNCDRCTDELSAYLDGELSPPKMREMESHFHTCEPCARDLRSLRASSQFVEKHAVALELPEPLWQKVRARIEALPERRSRASIFDFLFARPLPAMAMATALIFLLAGGIRIIFRHLEDERVLAQYMSSYIHDRDRQEETEKLRQAGTQLESATEAEIQPEDNPFVTASFSADDNPFRSEDQ